MPSTLRIVTRARATAEQLFDLSLDVDAHRASMGSSAEQAVAGVMSGGLGLGDTVTWRARHFGVWFSMTVRISAYDRPRRFVDEQVSGPFRSFVHEHRFDSDGPDTVMVDTITLGSPVLGRAAETWVLVPYLRRIVTARNRHLVARLGG